MTSTQNEQLNSSAYAMSAAPNQRLSQLFGGLVLAALGVVLVSSVILPAFRKGERASIRAQRQHVGHLLGSGIALHAGSRWLRHPEASEPHAAFQDDPQMMDTDPAGAWTSPHGISRVHRYPSPQRGEGLSVTSEPARGEE